MKIGLQMGVIKIMAVGVFLFHLFIYLFTPSVRLPAKDANQNKLHSNLTIVCALWPVISPMRDIPD